MEKYRRWLEGQYGASENICVKLVFAHNDIHNGNILRMVNAPDQQRSAVSLHKQLVVIDFKYSNANLPGFEFANHFTEWCYDYGDGIEPFAINTHRYPTPEEQDQFVRAYVRHKAHIHVNSPEIDSLSAAPSEGFHNRTHSCLLSQLDAGGLHQPEQTSALILRDSADKSVEDAEVHRLMRETRLWRAANSAQWVAWGIIQARSPGIPVSFNNAMTTESEQHDTPAESTTHRRRTKCSELLGKTAEEGASKMEVSTEAELLHEPFDYLGYAQHCALFFWGDLIQLELIGGDRIPEKFVAKLKAVPY